MLENINKDDLKNLVANLIDEILSERHETQAKEASRLRNELHNRLRENKEKQIQARAAAITLITKPDVILEPWCNLGTPGTDYIIPVQTSIDPDIMTQDDGIPVSMQTPLNLGGIPVPRNQTNGYIYLYSSILAWIQAGGTFTFEPTVSAFNSGYPMGTVLWAASVNNFVVSLINNNTNNFVTTPSFIDGVHWQTITALNYPDITDTGGLVHITGANGLSVINTITGNGGLFISKTAQMVGDGLGPKVAVIRSTNTLPSTYTLFIDAEDANSSIPGATHIAYITFEGGAFNPAIGFSSDVSNRPFLISSNIGDTNPGVYPTAIAGLGDIVYGFPSEPFTFPDGTSIIVNGTNVFPTPNGISLSGHFPGNISIPYPPGNTVVNINLITEGIITAPRVNTNFGPATGGLTQGILATAQFDGTNLVLTVNNTTASPLVADIYFSIEI